MASTLATSPLVQHLLAKIDQSDNLEVRAICAGELACYWARIGEFERAEEMRATLRLNFEAGHTIHVSILIMCIEALLMYFRELNPNARDRMARARLLSSAARDSRLTALTSAWMAHIDFNLNRFETMADAIRECLTVIGADDQAADCRVSLVLGDAHLFCKEKERADDWYKRAHTAATSLGDHAAIGALTYNRAALNVANARLGRIDSLTAENDLRLLCLEVQSAINYQRIASLKSLDHLLAAANVGVMILQGRFFDALPIIQTLLKSGDVLPDSGEELLLRADEALCLANSNQVEVALHAIDALDERLVECVGPDDQALIWHSIGEASRVCGMESMRRKSQLRIAESLAKHNQTILRLSKLLAPLHSH